MNSTRSLQTLLLATLLAAAPLAVAQERDGGSDRDLERVFGPDGSVLVPYDELLRLIRGETRDEGPPPLAPRPVNFQVLGARVSAVVGEARVAGTAVLDVECTGEPGALVIVPIGLDGASLEGATAGGKTAVLGRLDALRGAGSGYAVVLRGAGRHTVEVTFSAPVTRHPAHSNFSLTLPGASLNQLEVTLPKGARNVSMPDALAAPLFEGTSAKALFRARAKALVSWIPRPRRAVDAPSSAREAQVDARTTTCVKVSEGALRTTARVDLRVLQAPIQAISLRIPTGATILEVEGLDLLGAPLVKPGPKGQSVRLNLAAPVEGKVSFVLSLDQTLDENADAFQVQGVTPLGVLRHSGALALRTTRFLELETSGLEGLSKVPPANLSAEALKAAFEWSMGDERPPLTFEHPRSNWSFQARTKRVQAEVDGVLATQAIVKDDEVILATSATIHVRRRPIFRVRFALPQGFQLLDVQSSAWEVGQRRVDEGAEGQVLTLNFKRPLPPSSSPTSLLIFGLVREGASEAPAGTREVSIPRLRMLDVTKESGLLAVGSARHLELSLGKRDALWTVPLSELEAQGFPHGKAPGQQLAFAFRYGQAKAASLTCSVAKREPRVVARTETLVDAQEDQVRVSSTLHVDVDYAGIERLRLRGPALLAKALTFERRLITSSDVQVEGDEATWTITLQGKRSEAFALGYSYTIKVDDLAPGQQRRFGVAPIKVLDCARQSEEIAIKKHPNLVLTTVSKALLEDRDPRALAGDLSKQSAVRGYRVEGWPFSLVLELTKYAYRAPVGILIHHLHQDEVIGADESGTLKAEAILTLQNKSDQHLRVALPPGAQVRTLLIEGQTQKWQKGEAFEGRETLLINLGPVTKRKQGAPFKVRLRYNAPLPVPGLFGSVEAPPLLFPRGETSVPINRHTRTLHLPKRYAYLSFNTSGTKHFVEEGVWNSLRAQLRRLRGQPLRKRVLNRGASDAEQAIRQLQRQARGRAGGEPLSIPAGHVPYVFERQGGGLSVSAQVMAWPLFYLLDLLVLVGVVVAGFLLDKRGTRGSPWAFPLSAAALSLAGGAVLGQATGPFFAAAFLGSLGLIAYFLLRSAARELGEVRRERQAERTQREAQVARERARAAEAEERSAVGAGAPAGGTGPETESNGAGGEA